MKWTVLALGVAALACRGKVELPPPPPVHDFCLQASPRLNWHEGRSHTLYVRVFQLSSADGFAQADAAKLLDSEVHLAGVEGLPLEHTIYPESKVTLRITQRPEAQLVGIVAAYYRLDGAGRATRPMAALKTGTCLQLGPNGIEPEAIGPTK